MNYFYLSFVDKRRPEGQRFLGATVIEALTIEKAIQKSILDGINPGGCEIATAWIPDDTLPSLLKYKDRLVSKEELNANGEYSEYDQERGLGAPS